MKPINRHLQHLEEAEERCKPLPGETFKLHPYYEGTRVSNFGRVISYTTSYPHLRTLSIWEPSPYLFVMINPIHKKVYVHTLVAETFLGPRPEGLNKSGKRPLYTVSHLDNDPLNNHADNLMWETLKDNMNRSPLSIYATGKDHPRYGKKHTEETKQKMSESIKRALSKNA